MLDYVVLSEIGKREVNEDYALAAEKDGKFLFVVCDGLGGHGMGDVASQFVSKFLIEQFNSHESYQGFLESALGAAQEGLISHQEEVKVKNKMRTTVTTLLVDSDEAFIGHVGDSRVYVFDEDGVKVRTIDHSVPQMLALAGEIKESEIRYHPDRNVLLRAMGTEWSRPMYEIMPKLNLADCKAFLLCTDGFWEYIEEEKMFDLLRKSQTAEQWMALMKKEVEANGVGKKTDNFTAIAVINKAK